MKHIGLRARHLSLVCLGVLVWIHPAVGQVTTAQFDALRGRSIGPAGMSGRVAAIDVDPSNPEVIYVGAATGGVWQSVDGGISWAPIFDDQPVLGIGAVVVSPANPDVVWVGTGEGNPRNSAGVGYGVFKSMDAGHTWQHLGLENSERIHRIVAHPVDADIAYVGAMGPAWSDGDERGVYKTVDGGYTWQQVLWVNERTGVGDLVADPGNPDHLLAAMWEYRREPWFFSSGGEGSGLYSTFDGGETWSRLTAEDGLPEGDLGRIGLSFAPSDPSVVYALVEATKSELLRSDDGGRSWRTLSDEDGIVPRPFYYADLRVDPENENRIYSLHSRIEVTEDQGRTFRTVVPSATIHGDVHDLWIDPTNGRHMIIGNDGGIGITFDRGEHWRFVENLPLAQFYHVSVDDAVPFNVYGGLQDNGSWFGPMTVWESRGIMNAHWRRTGGGDGFASFSDPADSAYGYSMSQQGALQRFNKATGRRVGIQPFHPDGVALRFNWNAALSLDPHDPAALYLGSQFVHRTRDGGKSWTILSPDLTTNDPAKQRQGSSGGLTLDATGAENHTTLLSISPSPVQPGVLWTSSDDGLIHVTRDDGATWDEVGHSIGGVPAGSWIPHIEPSHVDPAVAHAVLEDHRRGNWTPYLYRTDDFGRSWNRVSTDAVFGFAHVVREDPFEPNLLFLGTEFGLYVSVDRGGEWHRWTHGVPPAPIRDLRIHPRDSDLAVGTHGRGIYILDDIRPLRALAGETFDRSATVFAFTPPPAQKYAVAEGIGYRSVGHAMAFGERRAYGALISYWVGSENGDSRAVVEITDQDGAVVGNLAGTARTGMNRVAWDLRPPQGDGGGFGNRLPEVLEGVYTVTIRIGDSTSEARLEVLEDPRVDIPRAERVARIEAIAHATELLGLLSVAQRQVSEAIDALDEVLGSLESQPGTDELRIQGEASRSDLVELRERLFTGPSCQGICGRSGIPARTVRSRLSSLSGSEGAPTPTEAMRVSQAEQILGTILAEVNALFHGPLAAYSVALGEHGYTPFPEVAPLRIGPGN